MTYTASDGVTRISFSNTELIKSYNDVAFMRAHEMKRAQKNIDCNIHRDLGIPRLQCQLIKLLLEREAVMAQFDRVTGGGSDV
jgi:hypothetical protein